MTFPTKADYVIIGAGIHGLSTAWHLGLSGQKNIIVLDKTGVGAGATGIACGVVRNNYFQPAMRELMAHSVDVWESDPEAFSYHSVGYMQISPEVMRKDVAQIYAEQQSIGYDSELIEGEGNCRAYMKRIFADWRAPGVVSVLHEKRGGFANNRASLDGLSKKAQAAGAQIISGVTVTALEKDNSGAICAVETSQGRVECGQVIIAAGPWVKSFWDMLELPKTVGDNIPMWRYWALEEGVMDVSPDFLQREGGGTPPVVHIDSNEPLYDEAGNLITDKMWGVYYKPDFHFNGIQGGAAPYKVERAADDVQVDPYGVASPEFIVGKDFARMWCAALSFCHERFAGKAHLFRNEPSGGLGCFTPDSFPVFDSFCENAYIIADSNHGYKMLGVGKLVAEEVLGQPSALMEPFRFGRYADGKTHPTSNSPFPWS
ncbi:MAG: NAD(P)/FAD-dependent oxidoreductase [Gammaproteobacteria bacterium WSBS_2016_MAG_OTU1]